MVHVGGKGRIVQGERAGQFLRILETKAEGIFIEVYDNADFKGVEVFDDWAADEAALERYFQKMGWQIEWLE